MALVGNILHGVLVNRKNSLEKKQLSFNLQQRTLQYLLQKAKNTEFGKDHDFDRILKSQNFPRSFQLNVPLFNYDLLFSHYWYKLLEGKPDITWPGKVRYFGLTSGTANDSSKRVPITRDMIKSIRRIGLRQLLSLVDLDLPPNFFESSILMLGGSTSLINMEKYFEGDLSGIIAGRLPFWFKGFYKPGQIAKEKDWNTKLDKIVLKAKDWNIGGVSGVPAWVQILIEKIIDHYGLDTIHDIWPNFKVYAHGGVQFTPYKKSFEKLIGKEIYYLETYLASEGFIAYQRKTGHPMQLALDNGIFFEFIPFNSANFLPDGSLVEKPEVLLVNEVKENEDYALIISTNAGTWRYLIGDTVRFTSVKDFEIVITGRTKHFLSLCGEHLSVDNMTCAISEISESLNIDIKEFTVAGIPYEKLFAHKWYIGTDDPVVDKEGLKILLDKTLAKLNDDYAVERRAALKEIIVEILPSKAFYDWLKMKGKEGGQHKFPRVIGNQHAEWNEFSRQYLI
ncbi:MAG TPA: GH3 auxin-responsive promoter family protein [Bacteroidales bacterium]|nr:GH3 auxin-responsive promoter family protein [Bacteroidales bacterium]